MTDEWAVYRFERTWNESTGKHDETSVTVYLGPARLGSFEAYEQTPEAGGAQKAVMRATLHCPVDAASTLIAVDDTAVCLSSLTDAELVGTEVRIAGAQHKTDSTARRFPVAEVL